MSLASGLVNRLGYRLSRATKDEALARFLADMAPKPIATPLIRIGGDGDGGYLVPDCLDGIVACFSPGVAQTCGFELDLAGRGMKSYMADLSVDGPPVPHPLFGFEKKFLGTVDDDRFTRLQSWMTRHEPAGGDLLLQMDIEGAEYAVVLDTPAEALRRFRIVVLELHAFDQIFVASAFEFYMQAMGKLLADFEVVHAHPNNCSRLRSNGVYEVPRVLEVTFLRRDYVVVDPGRTLSFPHPLDKPNIAGRADLVLPPCMR